MTVHLRARDHYSLLGVDEHASAVEIRDAYRRRAKQFHPDLNASRHATEMFLAVNEAYHVLRDGVRRQAYDESRVLFREAAVAWTPAVSRPQRAYGWFAGLGLAGALGAAALTVLPDPRPADMPPVRMAMAENAARAAAPENFGAAHVKVGDLEAALRETASDAGMSRSYRIETADESTEAAGLPKMAAGDVPSAPPRNERPPAKAPAIETWIATADAGVMPPVSPLDDLAEVPLPTAARPTARKAPAANVAPKPLAKRAAAAIVSHVRKARAAPIRTARYHAAVQAARARYLAAQAARARYLAAHAAKGRYGAAKAWMSKVQRRVVRRATKRRYAAY